MFAKEFVKKVALAPSMFIAIINLAMIIIGANFPCPGKKMITAYLIVAGSTCLSLLVAQHIVVLIILPLINKESFQGDKESEKTMESQEIKDGAKCSRKSDLVLKCLMGYAILVFLFTVIWTVVALFYVTDTGGLQFEDVSDKRFCSYVAYRMAYVFISMTASFFFLLTILCLGKTFFYKEANCGVEV